MSSLPPPAAVTCRWRRWPTAWSWRRWSTRWISTRPPTSPSLCGRTPLTLLVDSPPLAAREVNVFYGRLHTLDDTTSTVPAALEDVLATGAAAYAALEWASFASNRVNVGGADVWRSYLVWGQERLAAFAAALARHGRRSGVRARRLYCPALAPEFPAGGPPI